MSSASEHLGALRAALAGFDAHAERLEAWGGELGAVLAGGGRLLAVGNGGSAAQAQHLTGELVGRFRTERQPLSALALHAETSSVTAIANDYGLDEAYARQVRAHGREGDVLLCLSTSGASRNVLAAARAGRECGLRTWGLSGPAPNPLCAVVAEALCVEAPSAATVQELHLVAIHLLCLTVDRVLHEAGAPRLAELAR